MSCLLPARSIVGGILTDSNNKSYVAPENKMQKKIHKAKCYIRKT